MHTLWLFYKMVIFGGVANALLTLKFFLDAVFTIWKAIFFNKNKACYLLNSLDNHFHFFVSQNDLSLSLSLSLSRRKSFYLNKFCSKPRPNKIPNYLTVGRWLPSLKFSPSSFPYQELPVDSTVEASKDFALLLQRRVASAASVEKMQKTSRFCTMLLLGQVRKLELVFFF